MPMLKWLNQCFTMEKAKKKSIHTFADMIVTPVPVNDDLSLIQLWYDERDVSLLLVSTALCVTLIFTENLSYFLHNRLRWSQAHFSHIALQLSIYTLLIRNSSHVNTSQPQATANANTRPQSLAASIHHGLDGYVTFIITDKTYGKRYQIKVTENTGWS